MSNRVLTLIGISVVLLFGLLMLVQTASSAHRANGANGFPLDDPWIHLQFAKNLHEYGSFSYYKDQQVTAGSTSPLYTLLLTLGMFFTSDEFLLSYVLGGLFLLVSSIFMFRLGQHLFPHRLVTALAAAAIVVIEPRLIWIALSGMETTLFIALLLAVFLFYLQKRPLLLGVGAGLLLWTRPEALLMLAALAADAVYRRLLVGNEGRWNLVGDQGQEQEQQGEAHSPRTQPAWLFRSLLVLAGFGVAYTAFNYALSGSLFPNTFAAKLKFYSFAGQEFPTQLRSFLTNDYMIVFAPLVAIGLFAVLLDILRRRPAPLLIPLLWSLGMVAAYWWKLPHLVHYGRYLMPILPFVALLGVGGLEKLLQIAGVKIPVSKRAGIQATVRTAVLLTIVGVTAFAAWQRQDFYAETCAYITERQVATARWIRDHLPPDAVVATHDVGALAFYSERRIVDMVGLVSPEMIANIGRTDKLIEYLQTQDVSHVAVLRSWYEIDNVNPLFMTDKLRPEIMELFLFAPGRMHFTNQTASFFTERARLALASGNVQQAGSLFAKALQYDANAARIHHLYGRALVRAGQLDDAEREYRTALTLQPDLWDARFSQADVAVRRQRPDEAITRLEELVADNPEYVAGYQALAQLYSRFHNDAEKATYYLLRFNEATKRIEQGLPR